MDPFFIIMVFPLLVAIYGVFVLPMLEEREIQKELEKNDKKRKEESRPSNEHQLGIVSLFKPSGKFDPDHCKICQAVGGTRNPYIRANGVDTFRMEDWLERDYKNGLATQKEIEDMHLWVDIGRLKAGNATKYADISLRYLRKIYVEVGTWGVKKVIADRTERRFGNNVVPQLGKVVNK